MNAEFRNEEGTANANCEEGGDNDVDNDDGGKMEPAKYSMTAANNWMMHVKGGGSPIQPVPYTGGNDFFGIKLTEGDSDKMCNDHGTIQFHKVFKWLL